MCSDNAASCDAHISNRTPFARDPGQNTRRHSMTCLEAPATMKRIALLATLACATPGLIAVTPATLAQENGNKNENGPIEEVYVTARKRSESIQDVPISITAFGTDDLAAADMRALDDISEQTAGFQFQNQGNQQPGRYNTQLQFRGLTTAQFSPSFATGALFIDGVYVLNGGTSLSLMDVERVEIIKGPQSAYFGRNTFGGAVNLITRDPSKQDYFAEATFSTTDHSNNDLSAYVEGPIIQDQLSFSASARLYDKKGHFVANDGGRLGDEETTTFNGVLSWEPTDALSLKFRYSTSEDDDGAPAQAFISGIQNDTCTGRTINTPEGPANPTRYICGQVPDLQTAIATQGSNVISSNTIIPQNVIDRGINDPTTNVPGVPQVSGIGLKRETERISLTANYDFNDYSIEFIAARNEQDANWIRDFDLSDRLGWFSRDPQQMEDQSFELRLTGPQDGRLRWLVGVNSYTQEFTSSGGGGDASTSCFSTAAEFTDDSSTCIPGLVLLFPNTLAGTDEADVFGLFGAIDYDINDQMTIVAEGRFQQDELTKGGGLINPGGEILRDSFDEFLPRLIFRYQPNDNGTLFASYSLGQIAGDFNTFVVNADQRELDQYLAADPTIQPSTPAEELTALEVGWKQSFNEGRLLVNVALYRNEWEAIKGRSSVQINETCRAQDIGATGCDPALGIGVGDPKQIDDGSGNIVPFFNSRNVLIPGDATITGLEVETLFRPSDNLTMTFNLSKINAEYDDYNFNFVAPIAGFSQMRGRATPRQPEWAMNGSITYNFNVLGFESYVRGDMRYQGRAFIDESNLAYLDDFTIFNLRAGIESDNYRIEMFVNNLTDETAWATGARWTDFSSPTQFAFLTAKQGVAVSPQDDREIGLRVNYKWGQR
jgi:iron complex outermembrane receptor protein